MTDYGNQIENKPGKIQNKGQTWLGILLLIVGIAALLKISIPSFPNWIFSWPMLLIVIGIYSGFSTNFKGVSWLIILFIGSAFLAGRIIPALNIRHYIWPLVFISVGLYFIFDSKSKFFWKVVYKGKNKNNPNYFSDDSNDTTEEVLDSTSVFSGIKKNVISKNFKGGEVVSIMGGTEINMGQADIQGTVVLETFQLMGGTQLVVPAHWEIVSEMVCIFGGVEDNRNINNIKSNPEKRLVLKGTTIFGGLVIKNY